MLPCRSGKPTVCSNSASINQLLVFAHQNCLLQLIAGHGMLLQLFPDSDPAVIDCEQKWFHGDARSKHVASTQHFMVNSGIKNAQCCMLVTILVVYLSLC